MTSLILAHGLLGCGSSKNDSAPQAFGTSPRVNLQGEDNFASLMQKFSRGKSTPSPWAGYWYPFVENGIIDAAAKYEQATGRVGAVQWEIDHHSSSAPGILTWWGHCNGWSAASVLFAEPRTAAVQSGVPFSIGDQKALLSELGQEAHADFFGLRSDSDDPSDPAFQDIFPDQFFLVLTNLVGKGQPLIMDRYTGSQVWNHPIAGYETAPVTPADDLGADPSAPNIYRVMVTTQLWWARDDVPPNVLTEPFAFADGNSYESRILRYEVWMDAPPRFDDLGNLVSSGRIVLGHQDKAVYGGAWRMSGTDILNSHPDYMWAPYSLAPPGQYANPGIESGLVESIIKQAI